MEVLCGEWEIGNIPQEESGEQYNIALPIKEIKRHPKFVIDQDTLRTNYIQDDIAVILVDTNEEVQKQMFKNRLYPTCIPKKRKPSSTFGIHSGWSNPPPFYYVQNNAPLYYPHYRDFLKQWHYKMDFVECKDPIFSESPLDAYVHEFPSNTYYPPGVLCAKERDEYLCPTSGESGSPLMSTANKLTTEGILSFVKGCTRFAFGKYQVFLAEELSAQFDINDTDTGANVVIQDSDNPLVYTKLYCYLPWIAQQYGLEYDGTNSDDPDCFNG